MKRGRDEEDSEDSDEENNGNENVQVPSKKRRVFGYLGASSLVTPLHISRRIALTRDSGANDENTPIAPASEAENNPNKIHEDGEEQNDENVGAALGPAPALPLLQPAPVIPSTTRARRARALKRHETMLIGGQAYRLGDELPDDC